MTVEPGQTLLHYRLVDKLGEGGMGEVWRALDTTLDREVAIKILPEAFTADADRLARFEREAKLLASLDHPNIASVHGLHESDGIRFLAMELVPGEDLSQRLLAGPVPLEEAVEIGTQIAAGLEAAHASGVVHRDLKPANVRVAADGRVRVLDFGLAKSVESGPASGHSPTMSPTVTSAGTAVGVILGTAAYMSPEQARGKPVDRRSDVWSFGALMYELLTGQQAFRGETVTDVLASIVQREPAWEALPAGTPASLERLLRRCLRKDPRLRLRDMGDVGLMLEDSKSDPVATQQAQARSAAWIWPVLALIPLLILGYFFFSGRLASSGGAVDAAPTVSVTAMTRLTDLPGVQAAPSLSPDGKQLLYVSRDGGDRDIFLQRVGGENPVNLTADSPGNDFAPSFSPDGETIAFNSDRGGGGIFIMGATGESPRRVSDHGYHPSWTPDGRRLLFTTEWVTTIFGRSTLADLWEIDVETREAKLLFDGDASHARMSPGGRRIAYWTWWGRTQGQRDIWTVAADGSDPQPVTEDVPTDWNPWWSPDGKWLFFISDRGGSPDLWRVAIDEATGRPLGEPMAVTTGVASVADAGFSADGRRVAVTVDSAAGRLESVAFDPDGPRIVGEPTTLFSSGNAFNQMDLSRDGQWLAIRTTAPRETIYVMRTDGSGRRRLIDDEHRNRGPRWSPDGRWIVFYSNRTGAYELWATRSDGTEAKQLTVTEKTDLTNPVWSPDGRQIRATAVDADGSKVVRFDLPAEGIDGVDGPLVPNEVSLEVEVIGIRWSPDGKWIVGPDVATQAVVQYSPESGKYETVRDAEGVLRWGEFAGDWIDTSHFALWDDERQSAWVWDATTRTTRKLAGIEHPSDLRFGPDGRTLYLNRTINEGDVWLLTLDE